MGEWLVSLRLYVVRVWFIAVLGLGLVANPVRLAQAFGWLSPAFVSPISPVAFRIGFLTVTLIALFVWFHRQRMGFEPSRPANPAMPFYEVARHIAQKSEWAARRAADDDERWIEGLDRELTDKLSTGQIEAWGTLVPAGSGRGQLGMSKIPSDFWLWGQFDSADMVLGQEPPTRAYRFDRHGGGLYRDVRFDRWQVNRAWPLRGWWSALTHRSPAERTGAAKLWRGFDTRIRTGQLVLSPGEGFRLRVPTRNAGEP